MFTRALRRKNKSLEKCHARVTEEHERHSESRINETNKQRMKILNTDQEQHSFAHSIESVDHRVERLAHDPENHSQSCINESNEQRMRGLTSDRKHTCLRVLLNLTNIELND